jgi:tRNA pseudouridine38-40 synthase
MRYFLEIAYNGRNYSGWQVQPNADTIQAHIEQVLGLIFNEEIRVMGCGRTDTGVHASQFFLHFDTEKDLPQPFVSKLNRLLPLDIAVRDYFEVKADAHARFDAYSRTYRYRIHTYKDPYKLGLSTFYPRFEVDESKIQAAVAILPNYRDFKPLCKLSEDFKTTLCEVSFACWEQTDDGVDFTITSNRFLRNMIRRIVAVLVNIGTGKTSLQEFRKVMDEVSEFKVIELAPPDGLYLAEVKYPYL